MHLYCLSILTSPISLTSSHRHHGYVLFAFRIHAHALLKFHYSHDVYVHHANGLLHLYHYTALFQLLNTLNHGAVRWHLYLPNSPRHPF